MALHELVNIHGVKAWCIKAGEPHIPDYDQLQGIIGVLEAIGHVLSLLLVSDMGLKVLFVRG